VTNYDIIGDLHGHADALSALLQRMGYVHARGAWRHPSRTAVFVGDLIDRGPANIEASLMVRRMVEEGAALIVMGNHEFNAVAYHTEDPERPGEWLRPHDKKNTDQHEKTLAEFEARPSEARELLTWFATLPLYLDRPEIRIVHACWCRQSIAALSPLLNPDGSMPEAVFAAACREGSNEREARDILVSGAEIALPDGQSFEDKDGHPRTVIRLKWWLCGDGPLPLKDAGLGLSVEERSKLPDDVVSLERPRCRSAVWRTLIGFYSPIFCTYSF
jgi:hypothetical protein